MAAPLVLINAVGLTPGLLQHAPRLNALAQSGWMRPLKEVVPAVTCTAQATFLTGKTPEGHGIVGNGWLWRDTGEVRFWQQSNRLLQAEPIYQTAKRERAAQGKSFLARAEVIKPGRTLTVARADVFGVAESGDRELVATMLATIICLQK